MDAIAGAYASSPSSSDHDTPPRLAAPHRWAVHVRVPVRLDATATAAAAALAAAVAAAVPTAVVDPRLAAAAAAGGGADMHVSLSRGGGAVPTLGAAAALRDALAGVLAADAVPFTLALTGVAVLAGGAGPDRPGAAGARVFVCVGGGAPDARFSALARAVDAAVALVDLPPFHAVPLPHVSVAWAPAADAAAVEAAVGLATGGARTLAVTARVARVECRVGCRVWQVWRADGAGEAS